MTDIAEWKANHEKAREALTTLGQTPAYAAYLSSDLAEQLADRLLTALKDAEKMIALIEALPDADGWKLPAPHGVEERTYRIAPRPWSLGLFWCNEEVTYDGYERQRAQVVFTAAGFIATVATFPIVPAGVVHINEVRLFDAFGREVVGGKSDAPVVLISADSYENVTVTGPYQDWMLGREREW